MFQVSLNYIFNLEGVDLILSQVSVYKNTAEHDRISQAIYRWSHAPETLQNDEIILIYQNCLPETYVATEQGISIRLGEGDNGMLYPLTDTLILPCAEIQQHSLKGISRKLQLLGFRKGKRLEAVTLTSTELTNMRWFREMWGFKGWISPNIPNATQYIQDCIYILNDRIPVINKYCNLGWTQANRSNHIYVMGSEIIGINDTIQVYSDDNLEDFSIPHCNISDETAFNFVLDVVLKTAPTDITYTALSYMILSLTTSAFQDEIYKPDFIYYLSGPSGSRKTSISKIFFNMYERYWDAVPINFTATQPAMELIMVKMRDTVVLIDDIAPSINATERNATEKKLESIVRAYGDTAGRQKMGTNNKAVDMKPNGLAAITAEDNIFKNPSSMARCFITHIEKNDVDLKHLTTVQNKRGYYPTAIKYFITEIAQTFTGYVEMLKSFFLQSKHLFTRRHSDAHGRVINTAAWLDAAFSAYIQYGERRGFLTHEEAEDYSYENKTLLHKWIKSQSFMLKSNNEVDMYIYALKQLIASNLIHIPEIKVVGKQNKILGQLDRLKIIGYKDFDNMYLLPDVTYGEVRKFYSSQGIDFSVSQSTLLDRLNKQGILRPDNNKDGTKTVRITINGQRITVIRLDQDLFRWWGEKASVQY